MLIMVLFYCQNITQGWYTAMLTNTKILIADEDLRSRRSIKDALVKNGYRFVEEAENGEEAILLINRIHPDVVIADVWLSKLTVSDWSVRQAHRAFHRIKLRHL